jgi:polysaccharide biosynthesis transport protein
LGMTNMDSSPSSQKLMYNLSEYLAMGKAKCLYLDTNFSYSNGENQNKGWVNLLAGEINLEDVLLKSVNSDLHILPAGYARNIQVVSSISSEAIKSFFEKLSSHYDFILVNLPDLKKSADLQIIAPHLDGCFVNLKWGKSTVQSTKFYLQKSGIAANKILGALLSDTHLGKLKRHYGYDA